MAIEFIASGRDVTDEVVYTHKAVAISGATYYLGFTNAYIGEEFVDAANTTYGCWTAAAQGGTKLTVSRDTLPDATTKCKVNLESGHIITTTAQTLYLRYRTMGSVLNNAREKQIEINQMLPSTAKSFLRPCDSVFDAGAYSITVNGNRPNAPLSLKLYKTVMASGSSCVLTMAGGTNTIQAWQPILSGYKIQPNEYIHIYSAGASNYGFSNIVVSLQERVVREEEA